MTRDGVHDLAERVVRTALGEQNIETVMVREDDDPDGDPSLFIDVFLTPEAWPSDGEASLKLRHSLRQKLLAGGERRFAYLRFRDRAGEDQDEPSPAAT